LGQKKTFKLISKIRYFCPKCSVPKGLREGPQLVYDLRGFDRLELPQNDRKIEVSSRWLLQGWRANYDI